MSTTMVPVSAPPPPEAALKKEEEEEVEEEEEEDSEEEYAYAESEDEDDGCEAVPVRQVAVDVEATSGVVSQQRAYQWQKEWRECPYSGHQDETDPTKFFVNAWQDCVVEVRLDPKHPLKPPTFDICCPKMDPETTLMIRRMEFVDPKKWNYCTKLADLLKFAENALRLRGRQTDRWTDLEHCMYDLGVLMDAQPQCVEAVPTDNLELPRFGQESALSQADAQPDDAGTGVGSPGGGGPGGGTSGGGSSKRRKVLPGGWSAGVGYGSGLICDNKPPVTAAPQPPTGPGGGSTGGGSTGGGSQPQQQQQQQPQPGGTAAASSTTAGASSSSGGPGTGTTTTTTTASSQSRGGGTQQQHQSKPDATSAALKALLERIAACGRKEDGPYVVDVSPWQRAVVPFIKQASFFDFEKHYELFELLDELCVRFGDARTKQLLERRRPRDDDVDPSSTTGVVVKTPYQRALAQHHVLQWPMGADAYRAHKHHSTAHRFASRDANGVDRGADAPVPASLVKRAMREFQTLRDGLPLDEDTAVFARHNSDNVLHFKLCIVPSRETPYAFGCFVFSILLPRDYPASPPSVDFLTTDSGRVRFNPNLYNDGKVCLSLLGTWPGRPEEMWDPENSNLLSVALSIQALIFTDEPYFNEPGYESKRGTPAGDQAVQRYNQDVKVHTKRVAIDHYYKHPPPEFADAVKKHLDFHSDNIAAFFGAPLCSQAPSSSSQPLSAQGPHHAPAPAGHGIHSAPLDTSTHLLDDDDDDAIVHALLAEPYPPSFPGHSSSTDTLPGMLAAASADVTHTLLAPGAAAQSGGAGGAQSAQSAGNSGPAL